jgi:hypothetical protein
MFERLDEHLDHHRTASEVRQAKARSEQRRQDWKGTTQSDADKVFCWFDAP